MKRLAFVLALASGVAAVGGCGGDDLHPKLFSTDWLDDQGRSIAEVQARLRGQPLGAPADLVVAVAGDRNDQILGLPLQGGAPWSVQHALDARPLIAGAVVVGSGGDEIFALDAASGRKLWGKPAEGRQLLGAGDDGQTSAVALTTGHGSVLLVVAHDGSVMQKIETSQAIGVPAVAAGVVFVPWENQYVSAIDAKTGDELGRVVLRDKVSHAVTIGGGLYFGELAFVRFDDRIGQASRGGADRIPIPTRELPGTPRILGAGSEKEPPVANARDRDRLFARPASPDAPPGLDSGRFYASYFRLVIGFDAPKGNLAWVHTHPVDVIGGVAVQGGLLVCDETGKVIVLDGRTGVASAEKSFGVPIKSCDAHADTFRAPPSPAGGGPLAEQVALAVSSREASLATAQRLLLRELATMPDESATKTLIDIASDPRSAPVLVQDARAGIATRRNGTSYMLAALAKHYDYLHDYLATPPVGPIADALLAMHEAEGAPLLASHLLDPADSADDVRRAAAALAALATNAELPAIKQFFTMYRASAEADEVALAVASVAEAILRLDAKDGRATVEAASKDPMTNETARARLGSLLAASPAPAGAPAAPASSAPAPAPAPPKK